MKQSCAQLLQEFKEADPQIRGEKIKFSGVGQRDVYNITGPFWDAGERILAGRVEHRQTEDSLVKFFVERGGVWVPRPDLPVFRLQDPFISKIGGELIFGGVEISPHPSAPGYWSWRTNFYRGASLKALEKFCQGPPGMKDIRLVELNDGRIGVFTRPQGPVGGLGKIGFLVVQSLEDLKPEVMEEAHLLDQFGEKEWGGANEVHLLKNGLLGVLGHIACFGPQNRRHYYPVAFCFHPQTRAATPLKLIATRANFPPGPAKRPDLADVVFSGGLQRFRDGRARFYAGLSDAEAGFIDIPDPFLECEKTP